MVGNTGAGKTFLANHFLKILPFRCLVWDSYFQYSCKRCKIVHNWKEFIKAYQDNYQKIIFRDLHNTKENFEKFVKIGLIKHYFLIIEEIPDHHGQDQFSEMADIWTRVGRNFNSGGIVITQRPRMLNVNMRSQLHGVFLFRVSIPHENSYTIKWLEENSKEYPKYFFKFMDLMEKKNNNSSFLKLDKNKGKVFAYNS